MQLPGVMIPFEHVRNAAERNPDGCGYAFVHDGATQVRRFLDWQRMWGHYVDDWRDNPGSVFLMHFRWATHGSVALRNCHPFPLAMGGALIHNGVLGIEGLNKDTSDTKFLTKNIVDKLPQGWADQPWWRQVLTKYIGPNNKVAMLFDDGRYLILNEKFGAWKDGIWYSNSSWEAPKPVVVQPDDYDDLFAAYSAWDSRKDQDDCLDICPDCFDDMTAGHVCDVPVFVIRQLSSGHKNYGIVR